jgi:uncharacterized membrane protein YedE/YeeE
MLVLNTFEPLTAVAGGAIIGVAVGTYMLVAQSVAGNSGHLKSLASGEFGIKDAGYIGGLVLGGTIMKALLPDAFEEAPAVSLRMLLGSIACGAGAALGNGCTSGHGLCGLARFSPRSFAAVPTFMVAAAATATFFRGDATLGPMVQPSSTPASTVWLIQTLALALFPALVPAFFIIPSSSKTAYVAVWTGVTFALGLTIGGMVRPSVVIDALSPTRPNLTLWVLFGTALLTTAAFYYVARRRGIEAACAPKKAIDRDLLVGSAIFGVGWGATGICPGPLLVGLGATPFAPGLLLSLGGLLAGFRLAPTIAARLR